MPSIRLTVETITPLLMYGADQNQPELRGSSFRGILRYWLRAVLGAKTQSNMDSLFRLEEQYFGSTDTGSAVRIHFENHNNLQINKEAKVLPDKWPSVAIAQNSKFDIVFTAHPLRNPSDTFNAPFYSSLLLAFSLGGFGRRARRGGGAMRIKGNKRIRTFGIPFTADTDFRNCCEALYSKHPVIALKEHVFPYVNRAIKQIAIDSASFDSLPTYAVMSECVVYVARDGKNNYLDALKVPWSKSSHLHHIPEKLDMYVKGSLKTVSKTVDRWWAWGFAGINIHDRERYEKLVPSGDLYRFDGRRASTVHIRVHRYKNTYYPIVTIFRTLPDYDSRHNRPTSWELLSDFGEELENNGFERVYGNPGGRS